MNDERIDLSLLDPSRDPKRWERLVASVTSRALAAHRRRLTISYQLTAWARPALALAAAAALASWVGTVVAPTRNGSAARTEPEPAYVLSAWANGDDVPATPRILEVLGGSHGTD
jgi:hypothetical protein